jgi:hypothetical protein
MDETISFFYWDKKEMGVARLDIEEFCQRRKPLE